MDSAELTALFFEGTNGRRPESEQAVILTKGTIEYLMDCGFSDGEIFKVFQTYPAGSEYMDPEKLPESLWENSLTEKDTFYYHHLLRITGKPATVSIDGNRKFDPHFLEMQIRFPMESLLSYYYSSCRIDEALRDEKRDAGSFRYLLQRYEKLGYISGLDFVLVLIDYAGKSEFPVSMVMKLSEYDAEANQMLKAMVAEARKDRANKIIWRGVAKCRSLKSAG